MKKVLIANRGEIAVRIIRACQELGLKTVGIYAKEDEYSIHRFKADEAYVVGKGKQPIAAYLDIEDIIRVAKMSGADAIHPGYGFLSENAQFARRCQEEGITFVGPTPELLEMFGDKVAAKRAAKEANVQAIPGVDEPIKDLAELQAFGDKYGYPLMIKAAMGGGGRGMRVVSRPEDLSESYDRARSESMQSFGSDEIYVERFIKSAKHIEVQVLADQHGNVVHLFERDCSVQRRNQKVIEVAPCVILTAEQRERVTSAAVRFMAHVNYQNAATIEFLFEPEQDQFYFIEVNPRVQVEHTITEMITGIDIVQTQLKIAQGLDLFKDIGLPQQKDIKFHGAALQCRVTTEDPLNNFMPDTGTIETYRSPGGNGVRLDGGNAYAGAVITPYFDSLLVKVCTHAYTFEKAVKKMQRVLHEFKIRGVKTNIAFMENVIQHPAFLSGEAETTFIDHTPALFQVAKRVDNSSQKMQYIGDITVNGYDDVESHEKKYYPEGHYREQFKPFPKKLVTAKTILDAKGPLAVNDWLNQQSEVLLTDTTLRDAHQSLFATRMRTHDMVKIADSMQRAMPNLFSYEMWGGATFDVAYRFLVEDPWTRLKLLRQKMPHTLLQMLFRGSNAVGYKNYPDNMLVAFIKQAATDGIDVFRIFDSLNWVPQLEKSIQAVRDNNKIAEAAICYTGDILDPDKQKYNLKYYLDLAKELQAAGATIIGIKDMAGLLKPEAAYELVSSLKDKVDLPIHLHTHDTTGNGVMTYQRAIAAGVDVVDVAQSALSGTTSQPSMQSLYYALDGNVRQPQLDVKATERLNHYFEGIRPFYDDFANGLNAPLPDNYSAQMPGGQYSNLRQQAHAMGLGNRWEEVKLMYATVNSMFGDIVKVTPSSKVVGDMALFMVQHDLTEEDVYHDGATIDFPDSVINFFMGDLGQPVGGFPEKLQQIILKGKKPLTVRPGSLAKPVDFAAVKQELTTKMNSEPTQEDVLSYILYPDVFLDYTRRESEYGNVSMLDTPTFFQGMRLGERVEVQLRPGKILILILNEVGEPDIEGNRTLYFTVNGQRSEVVVKDKNAKQSDVVSQKAEPTNQEQIGASMTGTVLNVLVETDQVVQQGDPLLVTEAMKMETTIQAPFTGRISHLYVQEGDRVDTNDLLLELKPE
ncbi:pyruvate carboxylase [Loigolactobacillus backii]|uniref:Pyruvate carboxylase n=1 Tax=Loigolactobacillus backii TaxID=375175 RepID=A0A192H564_9LACO|nr:pyruvate carboxylase [Loigolactobacillus backii]ANK63111.1 pyruvate carboxylase [Loigolactobacillus backii]ANK69881.1 pyruvate carboxylase [Loigolactobacillus backii]MDA5387115.1 pyruvate carboxylase [Loigolactobacillus backii]MDA5389662.1 pyruvate carboxylase [Loigolactobacillus backii]PIO83641.1 pyruvate carboxylase [Loigolactobacillus backii]